jgi:hypothetical protein
MVRILRKILVSPLVFSLVFFPVLCCCSSQSAHAEDSDHHMEYAARTSEGGHGESRNPQDNHSGKNHNGECPRLQGTLAKSLDVLKSADIVLYFFNHQIISGKIFLAFVPDRRHSLIGPSPPQFSSSRTPLYIKNPTLRI